MTAEDLEQAPRRYPGDALWIRADISLNSGCLSGRGPPASGGRTVPRRQSYPSSGSRHSPGDVPAVLGDPPPSGTTIGRELRSANRAPRVGERRPRTRTGHPGTPASAHRRTAAVRACRRPDLRSLSARNYQLSAASVLATAELAAFPDALEWLGKRLSSSGACNGSPRPGDEAGPCRTAARGRLGRPRLGHLGGRLVLASGVGDATAPSHVPDSRSRVMWPDRGLTGLISVRVMG